MERNDYWRKLRTQRLSRRRMLTLGARAGVGAAGLALVGCGDDDDDDGEPTVVTLALDWVPNTNHTGFYVARNKGWYEDAGVDFQLLPYSGTAADTIVGTGQANFGISFEDAQVFARTSGLPNISVMAIMQHIGTEISVRADRDDIQSPADLDGKIYAGFGLPYEIPVMQQVIRNAGGTGDFETAILDTAAYEAVYAGRADFTVPFVAWESIEAELRGQPLKTFKYTDFGFPDFYQVVLIANEDWINGNEDLARSFVQASKRGFEFAADDPGEAAQILIDENPGTFELEEMVRRSAVLLANEFYLDESGKFGTQTLQKWTDYPQFLLEAGILADENGDTVTEELDWSAYFRTDLI